MFALMLVLGCVLIGEGSTIVRCLPAVTASGPQRLTRLGSWFLATEVWVLVLVGLVNAALPGVLGHGGLVWPLVVYVAAWMMRDLGLWFGPRLRQSMPARLAISAGAAVQLVAIMTAIVMLAMDWPVSSAANVHPWVGVLAVVMVLIGLGIDVVWLVLLRHVDTQWFCWVPTESV